MPQDDLEVSEKINNFVQDLYTEIEIERVEVFNKNKQGYYPSDRYNEFVGSFFQEIAEDRVDLNIDHVGFVIDEIFKLREKVGIDKGNEGLDPRILLPIYQNYFSVQANHFVSYPLLDEFKSHVDFILDFSKSQNFILSVAISYISNYENDERAEIYREVEYYLNQKGIEIDAEFTEACALPEVLEANLEYQEPDRSPRISPRNSRAESPHFVRITDSEESEHERD